MILTLLFALTGMLFASAGQAGGPGYVALLGFFGYSAAVIKPVALGLTMLVAVIGIFRFWRAGLLTPRDWVPYTVLGAPAAALGGLINLPRESYRIVLAVILLGACAQMVRAARRTAALDATTAPPPYAVAVPLGAAIGLVAGVTGIGGGLFIAWVMMVRGWAPTKRVAAAAQVSNFVTAAPAFIAIWASHPALPAQLPEWALAAAVGGFFGAWLGIKYLPPKMLRYLLAAILLAAGIKLILG